MSNNKMIIRLAFLFLFTGIAVLTYTYQPLPINANAEEDKYNEDKWVNGITPDEGVDADEYSDLSRYEAHDLCTTDDFNDRNEKFCDKLAKGEDNTVFADEEQQQEEQDRNALTSSEGFQDYLKSKGIDYDEDYDWYNAEEQKEIERQYTNNIDSDGDNDGER